MTKPFQEGLFTSKLPNTSISIFSKMTQLANEFGAVNLSQGFPDFEVDAKLVDLVTESMHSGFNQYAPMPGLLSLRQVISKKFESIYNVSVNPETEITITAGGTQALFTAIGTLIEKGDEVIIFEPAYDSYTPSIEAFGGKVVPVRLLAPDFVIDWEYVRKQITSKTKLIIINNPNNPTGQLLNATDLKELESIVEEFGVFILSDEVYEHLVYDNKKHLTVLDSEILRQKSYVVASFGKVLHTTGWKLGYIIGTEYLTSELRKIHQFNVFSVNTPMQHAVASYLEDTSYYESLGSFFEEKRNYLATALAASSFKVLPSQGTYFMLLDYSNISDLNELDFATKLIKENNIAMIPVSAFYTNDLNQQILRICFAKKQETLDKAIESLLQI